MSKSVKKRHWAFVLYPESAPENWFELLEKSGLQGAISPLHDKDIDSTGEKAEPKKPHYHVMLCYAGPTTFSAVKSFTDSLKQPIPQPLESVRGYYRYLTHKDNPDKYQYKEEEIRVFGGFCIDDFVELSKSEVLAIVRKLHQYIRDASIFEYSDFLDSLLDCDMMQEYDVATSHTMMFKAYLDSRRYKRDNGGFSQAQSHAQSEE